jgi:4-amino-4-deoxy-L-arabinose transferase-like glycosyltransferase
MKHTPTEAYTPRLDLIALAVIATSFAVRYWFVATGQLNLVQDEAQYWDWIRRPQLSYYSKGPLIAGIIATWCKVFGSTELGVRFGSVIGMTAIQAALYLGVSRVWRQYRLAVYVLFVAATMPLFNALGILMTTDNPLILCWTVAFFALSAATRNEPDRTPSNLPFYILGACMTIGILAKYMMLGFLALAFIHAAILQLRGQLPPRFWSRFLLASGVGSALGMLPILAWNMQNDWVGFKHVAKLSSGQPKAFTLRVGPFFEMLGAQIGLMTPWWFAFVVIGGWRAVRKGFFGPIGSFDHAYRRDLQAAIFFWPLWTTITLWSLKSKTEANWTAAAFMSAAILGGMALMRWWNLPERTRRARLILTGAAVAITLFIFLSPLAPLPAKYNITTRLKGWDNLGMEMQRLARTEFADPSKVFLFSDKYDITAELAFYTPGQPITFCLWTGDRRMNQYDIWPGPGRERTGWDAIMVRKRYHDGIQVEVLDLFESVGPPIHFKTSFHGEPAREYTLHLCKGFKGDWPLNPSGRY